MPKTRTKLSKKEQALAEEYLVDLNAGEAAKRAGYSEKTARNIGCQVLNKPRVQEVIQQKMDERSYRTEVTADKILLGLHDIAELDIGDAYDEAGRLLNVKDMPVHVRKAISSIKVFEEFEWQDDPDNPGDRQVRVKVGEVREVKFHPKIPAYEMQGRHLKLFADKLEVSFAEGLADKVARARKRATGSK